MKIWMKIIVCLWTYFFSELSQAYNVQPTNNKNIDVKSVQIISEIYPPYQYIDKQGELQGWSAEKVKAIFNKASIDYHIDFYPWTRAYNLAQTQPDTFIFSLLKTKIREPLFQWVVPLCTIEFSFYRLKKRTDIKLSSMKDAKQYLIAAQQGQASAEYLLTLGFEPGKNLTMSYNNDTFIQMLVYGRVELIVLASSYVESLIAQNSPYINEIEAIFPIHYLKNNMYLASSLNTSSIFIERLRKANEELTSELDHSCDKE